MYISPSTIGVKYAFVVPEKHDFEIWIGKKVGGYWPTNLKELAEAARHSFPPTAKTALTMPHANAVRVHGPLPLCSGLRANPEQ